jgi:hypothetical protein
MHLNLALLLFLVFPAAFKNDRPKPAFDRQAFYAVMSTGRIADVNRELELLKTTEVKEKQAYEGALLMRKAGLMKIPAEKLHFFKLGYMKLEPAIAADKENVELHFLRLTIQEHAPHIVKYYHQIDEDKAAVIKGYKTLPSEVKDAVMEYSKTSKVLHPQDL